MAAERCIHLDTAGYHLHNCGHVWHGQPEDSGHTAERTAGDFQAQAHVPHHIALHHVIRFVHRLFRGIPAAYQDTVCGSGPVAVCFYRPATRRTDTPNRRLGFR